MNIATEVVYRDLLEAKTWSEVTWCINDELKIPYLVAKKSDESLKIIVVALHIHDEMSHQWLDSVFNSLYPPGDLDSYERGLLLAIVGSSSIVVYHQVMSGIVDILPQLRSKSRFV